MNDTKHTVRGDAQWWQGFLRGEQTMPRPFSEKFQQSCKKLVYRLAFTVPLHIHDLCAQGGIGDYHLDLLQTFSETLAEKGDVLMFERNTPEREELVRMLSEGLSIMAFLPGGVTFCGQHFEVTPK